MMMMQKWRAWTLKRSWTLKSDCGEGLLSVCHSTVLNGPLLRRDGDLFFIFVLSPTRTQFNKGLFCFQTNLILGTQGVASNVFYVSVHIKSKQKLNYFLLAYCRSKILIKKYILLENLISMVTPN